MTGSCAHEWQSGRSHIRDGQVVCVLVCDACGKDVRTVNVQPYHPAPNLSKAAA